jgi:hypothetical protein
MTGPIDPVRRTLATRRSQRRGPDRRAAAVSEEPNTLPVLVGPPAEEPPPGPPPSAAAVYAAHLLGQSGQKRGLRAPETLETARAVYLGTEYSGPQDRRPGKGKISKTEI